MKTPAGRIDENVAIDFEAIEDLFVTIFIESHGGKEPAQVIIDLDPSDIPLHGEQEQRFCHGYNGHHCYLLLYAYAGEYPVSVQLRPSNVDGALGAKALMGIYSVYGTWHRPRRAR